MKKHCPKCNRTFRSSTAFCSHDGTQLIEQDVGSRVATITVIVLAAGVFGVAFGITHWAIQRKSGTSVSSMTPPPAKTFGPTTDNSAVPATKSIEQPTPRTAANVQLQYFTSTKTNDHPMPNELVVFHVNGKSLNARTNSRGFVTFNDVPCGKTVKIVFTGERSRTFSRSFSCDNDVVLWRYYFDSFAGLDAPSIKQVK